jgi:hypothetical protein
MSGSDGGSTFVTIYYCGYWNCLCGCVDKKRGKDIKPFGLQLADYRFSYSSSQINTGNKHSIITLKMYENTAK